MTIYNFENQEYEWFAAKKTQKQNTEFHWNTIKITLQDSKIFLHDGKISLQEA